ARRREGSYLLRSNITSDDPGHLWRLYLQLVEVEQAFKELKNDLSICRSVPSITSSKPESKPIFSLRFWPIVCWSRAAEDAGAGIDGEGRARKTRHDADDR